MSISLSFGVHSVWRPLSTILHSVSQVPGSLHNLRPGGGRGRGGAHSSVGEEEDEISELEQRIFSAELPEHALKAAEKELKVCVRVL